MKKKFAFFAAVVLLCSILNVTVLALPAPGIEGVWLSGMSDGFTVTPHMSDGTQLSAASGVDCDGDGAADNFYTSAAGYSVKYAPQSGLTAGDSYTLIMYAGPDISVKSILYLDESSVSEQDVKNNCLSFDINPTAFTGTAVIKFSIGSGQPVSVVAIHTYCPYAPGDVDGDGSVTTLDAVKVLQYCAGSIKLTGGQQKTADVDEDGQITVYDAVRILRYCTENAALL